MNTQEIKQRLAEVIAAATGTVLDRPSGLPDLLRAALSLIEQQEQQISSVREAVDAGPNCSTIEAVLGTLKAYESCANEKRQLEQQLRDAIAKLSKADNYASFIHPAAVIENGVETKRSEFKDGFNAAMEEMRKILNGADDERWVLRECYDRVEEEAMQLRQQLKDATQLKESALAGQEVLRLKLKEYETTKLHS